MRHYEKGIPVHQHDKKKGRYFYCDAQCTGHVNDKHFYRQAGKTPESL